VFIQLLKLFLTIFLLVEYLSNIQDTATVKTFECSQGFYQENGSSVCIPSCYTWTQYEPIVSTAIDVIVLLSVLVGFFAAITVMILSIIRRKRM